MIKAIITPLNTDLHFSVPENYVGKKVEVIAFIVDEPNDDLHSDITMTHFASEPSLAKDWLRKEEDEAWKDL